MGDQDLMLPSGKEGPRLGRLLPTCRHKTCEGYSHTLLQEAGMNLVEELDTAGFFIGQRKVTGNVPVAKCKRNTAATCALLPCSSLPSPAQHCSALPCPAVPCSTLRCQHAVQTRQPPSLQ